MFEGSQFEDSDSGAMDDPGECLDGSKGRVSAKEYLCVRHVMKFEEPLTLAENVKAEGKSDNSAEGSKGSQLFVKVKRCPSYHALTTCAAG